MKFALVDGQRQEALPNLSARCPWCERPMVPKCGQVRIWHWAHEGTLLCDPWWENETEWHRNWKGQFPVNWQEFVCRAENGEKHVADVRTDYGWVIEFQHSYIRPEERRSRDSFYPKLVWVVDGARRKRDKAQFLEAWEYGVPVGTGSALRKVFPDECALLREWAGSQVPIFFDFGEEAVLWWLLASSHDGRAYVGQFSRAQFIELHRSGAKEEGRDFDSLVRHVRSQLASYESALQALALQRAQQPLQGFQQYLSRRRFRRRF